MRGAILRGNCRDDVFSCGIAFADGFEIVVVPKDQSGPWFVRMNTGVEEYAAAHTEDMISQKGTPEIDPALQYQPVEDLIAREVDAIRIVRACPKGTE